MSDNFAAQLDAFKRMDKEDRDALWMMMAMMDRESIKTTMYLNQERMQYSLGKTEKSLQFASQYYYGNYSNSNDKDHNNKWSTGKLSEKKQPERFYDYPIELNVKGGFDVFQEINLSKIGF